MPAVIVIRSWADYQHYKDRDPPWVKLHRNILTGSAWMYGNNTTRLVQVACILLAPRYNNQIPCKPETICKAGGIDGEPEEIVAALAHLVEHNFLDIQEVAEVANNNAIRLLASCTSEAEAEAEKTGTATASPPANSASAPLAVRRGTRRPDPEWLEAFKATFPKRAGDPNWRGAIRAGCARLQQGHTVEEFMAGAGRYAAYIRAKGEEGTEFVQQASRFLGPGKPFLLPWDLPKQKGNGKPVVDPWVDLARRAQKVGFRDPYAGESPEAYHTALSRIEEDLRRGRSTTGPARVVVPELRQ